MGWRVAAIGVLLIIPAACARPATRAADGAATVTHVVDGDTIDVRVGGRDERIRLIGIDTPETKKPDHPVECYGPEATAHTDALLPVGTTIRIERDVVGRDDYGRLLGYVYVPERSGELFVNLEIVRRGYATTLTIEPNSAHAAEFAAAARAAESADLGLWAACSS